MLKTVHFAKLKYSFPGDYNYERELTVNLKNFFKDEDSLISTLISEMMNIDVINDRFDMSNYGLSGITLLDNLLVGSFTLADVNDEYLSKTSFSVTIFVGLFDSENNILMELNALSFNN